jgi:hypothetical protein
MSQREFDHLPHLADLVPEPADVLVVHLRDLRLLFLRRLLRHPDLRLRFDEDGVGTGRERCDDEVEFAAHHAHAEDVPAGDHAALEHLGHVLLPAHDPDWFGRGERHLLRGTCHGLSQTDLVVDAHPRIPALHAVHANHATVRVLRVSAPHDRRGRFRT